MRKKSYKVFSICKSCNKRYVQRHKLIKYCDRCKDNDLVKYACPKKRPPVKTHSVFEDED